MIKIFRITGAVASIYFGLGLLDIIGGIVTNTDTVFSKVFGVMLILTGAETISQEVKKRKLKT